MFTGHDRAAFVAAPRPKAPNLGTSSVATQLVNIGFFGFVSIGVGHLRFIPRISAMNLMDL